MQRSVKLILAALLLLLIGVILPFLMVIEVIESSLVLSFFAFACSTVGLVLGFAGIVDHVRNR